MNLIHLIYTSIADPAAFGPAARRRALPGWRANNARVAVSGLLLDVDGELLHLLEGSAEAVDELFLRIVADDRHRAVGELLREPISGRRFAPQALACERLAPRELARLVGPGRVTRGGLARLEAADARRLFAAFTALGPRHEPAASRAALSA